MNVDKLIEKGNDAHKKRNYDYAISIFLEAVAFAPNNRRAREGLRNAALKKHEPAYPSKFAVAIFGLGARMGMFFAGLGKKGNPEAYMMACERFLKLDPKNLKVNLALGDAAANAGHADTAVVAYEIAAEHHAEDVTALKSLGNLLWRKGDIQRAHETFDRAVRLSPRDQEALKARKNLAAEASLKQTGFETAKSSQELVKDKDAAARIEAETRIFRTADDLASERAKLEEKLAGDVENVDLMLDLVEICQKENQLGDAVAMLDRALKLRPTDTSLQFQKGDLIIIQIEEDIRDLTGKGQDTTAKKGELLAFRSEEFERRVTAYPTDLNFRFTLGELLFEKGETDAAIAEFQRTVRDPKYKSESQLRLGQAFASKGQYDMAVRQFENALEGQTGMTERVKQIHYSLGDVHETKGDKAKAKEEFGKVYEVDINFRDIGERISALSGTGEEKSGLSLAD